MAGAPSENEFMEVLRRTVSLTRNKKEMSFLRKKRTAWLLSKSDDGALT